MTLSEGLRNSLIDYNNRAIALHQASEDMEQMVRDMSESYGEELEDSNSLTEALNLLTEDSSLKFSLWYYRRKIKGDK